MMMQQHQQQQQQDELVETSEFPPSKSITTLLRENHIEDWDQRVIYQLLEFQYRTTKEILKSSKKLCNHRGGNCLSEKDVSLALTFDQLKSNSASITSKQEAQKVNSRPLPSIQQSYLRIPRGAYVHDECFSELVEETIVDEEEDVDMNGNDNDLNNNNNNIVTQKTGRATGKYNVKKGKRKLRFGVNN